MLESFSDSLLFSASYHLSTDLFRSVATHVGLNRDLHTKISQAIRPILIDVYYPLLLGKNTYETFIHQDALLRFKFALSLSMEHELDHDELQYLIMWLRTIADLDERRNAYYWFGGIMSTEASRIRRYGAPSIMVVDNFLAIEQAYTNMVSSEVVASAEVEVRHRIVNERLSAWDYLVVGAGSGMLDCPIEVKDLACESTFYLMMNLRGTCKFLCWLVNELPSEDIVALDKILADLRGDDGWPTIRVLADTASGLFP